MTISKDASRTQSSTSGAVQLFQAWHVQPHPDYGTRGTVRKQEFDYSFLYLLGLEDQFSATQDAVVHLDTFWISST